MDSLSNRLKSSFKEEKSMVQIFEELNKEIKMDNIVYISEIAPYNEYDWACNGGFFNCPSCACQLYTSESEDGDISECSECGEKYIIKE